MDIASDVEIEETPAPLTRQEAEALLHAALPGARAYKVRGRCAIEVGGNVIDLETHAPLVATGPTWEAAIDAALRMVGR